MRAEQQQAPQGAGGPRRLGHLSRDQQGWDGADNKPGRRRDVTPWERWQHLRPHPYTSRDQLCAPGRSLRLCVGALACNV